MDKKKKNIGIPFLFSFALFCYSAAVAIDIFLIELKIRSASDVFPLYYYFDYSFFLYTRHCVILFFVGLLLMLITKYYEYNDLSKDFAGDLSPYTYFCLAGCLVSFIRHLYLVINDWNIKWNVILQLPTLFVLVTNIMCLVLVIYFIIDLYINYLRATSWKERIFLLICMTLTVIFYSLICYYSTEYLISAGKVHWFYERQFVGCRRGYYVFSEKRFSGAMKRVIKYLRYRPIFPYTERDEGFYKRHTVKAYLHRFYLKLKTYILWPYSKYRQYEESKGKKK